MQSDARVEGVLDVLIDRLAEAVADRLEMRQRPVPEQQPSDGLLDEPAMAKRLSISQQTLQRRRKAGTVPFVACGRRVLYRPEDVIAALQVQEKKGGAA